MDTLPSIGISVMQRWHQEHERRMSGQEAGSSDANGNSDAATAGGGCHRGKYYPSVNGGSSRAARKSKEMLGAMLEAAQQVGGQDMFVVKLPEDFLQVPGFVAP